MVDSIISQKPMLRTTLTPMAMGRLTSNGISQSATGARNIMNGSNRNIEFRVMLRILHRGPHRFVKTRQLMAGTIFARRHIIHF